ncbi:MAG: hypothetical protein IIY56_03430 [Erysipelotrichaceae bacterium]|nr:hypothetical protein [Erysipelotrichaceae bacterium]
MKKIAVMLMCLLMLLSGCGNKQEEETIEPEDIPEETVEVGDVNPLDSYNALYLWGADPGLGIRTLHELGYTGEGINVAYIDQPINDVPDYEIADSVVYNKNIADEDDLMHGQATSSLLCGKNLGTAPGVNLYFFGYPAWKEDQQQYWVTCMDDLIEQNRKLPDDEKIRMAGFSNNPRPDEKYYQDVLDSIKRCNDEGIMVWFCGENGAGTFKLYSDRNNKENLEPLSYGQEGIGTMPAASRTTLDSNGTYQYDDQGGLSWTMPYSLGGYCIALSIDNTLTEDEIRQLVIDTAYLNGNGLKVFDPIEFIAHVLERVGRNDNANELRKAYLDSLEYVYIIYNSSKTTETDLEAISRYADEIITCDYVLFDCKDCNDAQSLYTALQESHKEHGGKIAGIQIIGDVNCVAPFEIKYEAQMDAKNIDSAGTYYTDYFYQNLNNDVSYLGKDYSVSNQFANGLDVDLTPLYPLARLPLSKGEFSLFFEKYLKFAEETKQRKLTLVNFSNPIFAETEHSDDMGYFLNRMYNDYKLLDEDYVLYGNLKGQYPIATEVKGDMSKANLEQVNSEKPVEFLINTHGQKTNVDICYYENDNEVRESFFNTDNINSLLNDNYYYLDMWTCNNGEGMSDNLTVEALRGNAVGVFSATHIISNNGVKNSVSVGRMKNSNFYYFYFTYLRTRDRKFSRAASFYKAQYRYALALIEESEKGIQGTGNYQFNLNNLLDYENFGVLDRYDLNTINLNDRDDIYDNGQYLEEMAAIENSIQGITDYEYSIKRTTAGTCVFSVTMDAPEGYRLELFNPPNADIVSVYSGPTTKGLNTYYFEISEDVLKQVDHLTLSIRKSDDDRCFLFFTDLTIDESEIVDLNEIDLGGGDLVNGESSNAYLVDLDSYKSGEVKVVDYLFEKTESGTYRYTVTVDAAEGYVAYFFDPPGGNLVMTREVATKQGANTFSTEISEDVYQKIEMMVLCIYKSDDDRCFVYCYK